LSTTKRYKKPRSATRGILEGIVNAKTPQTRAKRITATATLAANNERANQWTKELGEQTRT